MDAYPVFLPIAVLPIADAKRVLDKIYEPIGTFLLVKLSSSFLKEPLRLIVGSCGGWQ